MRVIVDAYGGDNAPLCVIKGAADAAKEFDVDITLCGNSEELKNLASENGIDIDGFGFIESDKAISMHEDPTEILKGFSDCSMAEGLKALADGRGDAFVSAGSTGALLVGATFITKRIRGIKRPAMAPLLPCKNGNFLLVDCGANAECRPEMLCQFGIMGSVYAEKILGIKEPRVGLVNIGAEETKGTENVKQAYGLLKSQDGIRFVGNIEGNDIPMGKADVVVTDGFTGNVILKYTEGMGKFMFGILRDTFMSDLKSKLAALVLKSKFKGLKKMMDPSEVGGTVILGVKKAVIKAHGSSNDKAIKNAIRQAVKVVSENVIGEIESAFAEKKEEL